MSPFFAGSLASLLAGLATAVGALPVIGLGKPTDGQQNLLLGFAAGVMLAASFFSLIIPALAQLEGTGASRMAAAATVIPAILIGGCGLAWLNGAIPQMHGAGLGPAGLADEKIRRVWLLIGAITLHNFPEGMAVGVSFGGGDFAAGMATAIGIGIQNMPEGLAVAGAALSLGHSRGAALLIALLSGLPEPIAGTAGAAAVALAKPLLPWGLGAAAGAMIYIVVAEIIPDNHRRLEGRHSMTGFMVGLAVMLFLDISLG